jgi:hypothetical protein
MSNRFHNKFHRFNHHSAGSPDPKYPDAGYDPIASFDSPFQGEFYSEGDIITTQNLSAGIDLTINRNALIRNNLVVGYDANVKNNLLIDNNLSVQGDTTRLNTAVFITSSVDISVNSSNTGLTITQSGIGYALRINDSNQVDSSPFAIDNSGHILVSTLSAKNAYELVGSKVPNPSYFLATLSAQANDSGLFIQSVNGIPFYVEDGSGNDTTPVIIDSDGKLGVGLKFPNERLTVSGNISATGNISSDKQFLFADGSVSAPSIANKDKNYFVLQDGSDYLVIDHTSDDVLSMQEFANNGIYIPLADTLGFVTNGIDRLRITQDGKVGIGTTSPGAKLTVSGTLSTSGSATVGTLAVGTTDSVVVESSGLLQKRTVDSRVWSSSLVDGTGTANRVAYWTDSNTITADNDLFFNGTNLGVGATTPNERLTVSGNISATGNISSDKQFLFVDGSASAPSIANKDKNYFVLQDGSDYLVIDHTSDDVLSMQEIGNNGIYIPLADTLGFVTNGTEQVRINALGQILIADGSVSAPSIANKDKGYFMLQDGSGSLDLEGGEDPLILQENNADPFCSSCYKS